MPRPPLRSWCGCEPRLWPKSQGRNVGGALRVPCERKCRRKRRRRWHFSTRKGVETGLSLGPAPPELAPQVVAVRNLTTGRRCTSPVSFPCPSLGQTGPQQGTSYQQPGSGNRWRAAHLPEVVRCRGGPARAVPSERDKSGGPGAACAQVAGARRRRRPKGLWVGGVLGHTHVLEI